MRNISREKVQRMRKAKKTSGFPVSRPYLAFGRRNPDPKLFYWIVFQLKGKRFEEKFGEILGKSILWMWKH